MQLSIYWSNFVEDFKAMIGKIFFHLIIVVAGVYGILTGYKKGLMRQLDSVTALAFAVVAAYIVSGDVEEWLWDYLSSWQEFNAIFVAKTLSVTLIFIPVYFLLKLCLFMLARMMTAFPGGILNSIGGAIYKTFKYFLFISLFYNLLIDLRPTSALAETSRHHDGNIVEGVVKIAPFILGFPGGEEVVYHQQLEDAKKIS